MEYTRLGNTGLKVSRLALGCMSYGDPTTPNAHPWALAEDEAQPFFQQAVELGVTFWDTANVYQLGTSEEIVGRAITRYSRREDIVVATKVRGKMHDGPGGEGLSRKAILEQVDASLTRLGKDYIDLYQIHRFDPDTPVEETMEALHDIIKAGKVRYIGASSMYAWQFSKLQHAADSGGWTTFVSMQNHYNLLRRHDERELMAMCGDMGVGLVPYSPNGKGRLARPAGEQSHRSSTDKVVQAFDSPYDEPVINAVQKLAESRSVSMAQIALAWVLRNPLVTAPIVGATKPHHLPEAIDSKRPISSTGRRGTSGFRPAPRLAAVRFARPGALAWASVREMSPDVRRSNNGSPAPLSGWVAVVAGLQAAVLVATSTRYGYHGDEFYFIVAGSHPALGYPDQPPLVPLLSWLMHDLAPGSLLLLRLPSAFVGAITTVVAALVAREVGGTRRAQLIAAACTAVSGFALAASHLTSTTTFDLLSTTALLWLVIRALVRQSGASLLAAGLVVGVGSEAKPQVGVVAVVAAVALAAVGPRWPLRSWWTAGGVLAALLLAAPYLIWQWQHGWPQVTVAGNIAGSAEGGRAGFIPFQLVMVSVFLVPVWIAGLLAPFRRAAMRSLRVVPLTYLGLALVYLVGDGKAYYLASLYPVLLGLGALPTAEWTLRRRFNFRLLTAAIAVSAAINAFIALPLLPEKSLQGSAVMALNPDQGETVGWPRFIDTIATAWHGIPADERAHTAIFTWSYHEAGAIDVLGHGKRLPHAYSGHNGFGEWGKPAAHDTHALIIGYNGPADAAPYFRGCRTLATINNGVGLENNQQGLPVQLCQPAAPWATIWPHLIHYD